jgi:hypothetical protein
MHLSSFAVSVGLWPLIFAAIVGSKRTLFASPSLTVCKPLQLGCALAQWPPTLSVRALYAPNVGQHRCLRADGDESELICSECGFEAPRIWPKPNTDTGGEFVAACA